MFFDVSFGCKDMSSISILLSSVMSLDDSCNAFEWGEVVVFRVVWRELMIEWGRVWMLVLLVARGGWGWLRNGCDMFLGGTAGCGGGWFFWQEFLKHSHNLVHEVSMHVRGVLQRHNVMPSITKNVKVEEYMTRGMVAGCMWRLVVWSIFAISISRVIIAYWCTSLSRK